jgi:FAD synthetase
MLCDCAANLQEFSPSTEGWAGFMRVNPVLDWEYGTIWQFLRQYRLPYCALYDQGYSSVGLPHNTKRNPLLVRDDGTYHPAWILESSSTERGGRADR